MKKITREWVHKAEGDFNTLLREVRARKAPNYDAACFHAQQCIEKYIKAVLQESDIPFNRTHNLTTLLEACLSFTPEWEGFVDDARDLNAYAIDVRYPSESADRKAALDALAAVRKIRRAIRSFLGLAE